MYALQNFIPDQKYHLMDPYVTPYILPATQISLTGMIQTILISSMTLIFVCL